ncbi:MAG: hypothetical protein IJB69_05630 [Clostridia bacterium]|nr:hypothetical protein [Clostridia bacterium]
MDWHMIVPREGAFTKAEGESAWEVRLRCGRPMQMTGPFGVKDGSFPLTRESVQLAAQALAGRSPARFEDALREGYMPLPGGHRMGVCGHMTKGGLYVFSSLCVRMAHEIKDAAREVYPLTEGKNVLILGRPGSGKTTLLRDLVRRTAENRQVALTDTRGEIAACYQGVPQLDIGPRCDVMTGGRKEDVMLCMLRAMSPEVMAADEIGSPGDALALSQMQRCGVNILTTAHAASLEEARQRRALAPLFDEGIFHLCILLSAPGEKPRILPLCGG